MWIVRSALEKKPIIAVLGLLIRITSGIFFVRLPIDHFLRIPISVFTAGNVYTIAVCTGLIQTSDRKESLFVGGNTQKTKTRLLSSVYRRNFTDRFLT
ncbi:hypothetical protein ACFQ4C_05350 [Larkinella insperata]|uniref:Uncharacterized protein n=1 Tax=Larkinella insperata TaxID=332158 RepID=A0ABW3Q7C6_9BACT|nr:hypothetical protein [Larkinella insperata]